MRNFLFAATLMFATATAATSALAAELAMDTVLGTTVAEVRSKLTEMGYEARKSEMEHGGIEVYFVKGNQRGEVTVSASTGKVIKLKMQ